jgi:hypothetical protein
VTSFARVCERRLADGGRVRLRPIQASDAEALVALHGRKFLRENALRVFKL